MPPIPNVVITVSTVTNAGGAAIFHTDNTPQALLSAQMASGAPGVVQYFVDPANPDAMYLKITGALPSQLVTVQLTYPPE